MSKRPVNVKLNVMELLYALMANRIKKLLSDTDKGFALILVLWVLAVLTVIVLSFSYASRTETLSTLSFKQTAENKFLAEAGIERGIMELIFRMKNSKTDRAETLRTNGSVYTFRLDSGQYRLGILDESGKVDINKTPEVILKTMLYNLGLSKEKADAITDSILDWRDADDLHRLNGAESDYYLSLPNPYMAKNADFESVEELLLIKGMTPEILYGDTDKRGIIDLLTVHSPTGRININSAPKEVLLAIPHMTPEMAHMIIDYRDKEDIRNPGAVLGQYYSVVRPYFTAGDSGRFTIDSTGYNVPGQNEYSIRATVSIQSGGSYRYLYYKSPVEKKYE